MSFAASQSFATTVFDSVLADDLQAEKSVNMQQAQEIFNYFKGNVLFRWSDANNDCEDRANAACMLLDAWNLPNAKAWVFSGTFRKEAAGSLANLWNYHVAAALPVREANSVTFYVIDPATSPSLITADKWALQITQSGTSYHFIKQGDYYIFPAAKIERDNWHKRNKRNHNWTMQGLSGINGVSAKGKAQLAFKKKQSKNTEQAFNKMKADRPSF